MSAKLNWEKVRRERLYPQKRKKESTVIIAKYTGTCHTCWEQIKVGAKIKYDGNTTHYGCKIVK